MAAADNATMNQLFVIDIVIAIAEKSAPWKLQTFFVRRSATASKAKADKACAKLRNSNARPEDHYNQLT